MPIDQSTLWRAIGRFEAEREADRKNLDQIREYGEETREKVDNLTSWVQRGALLAGLWIAAISVNLSPEQKGEAISMVLERLLKR